MWPGLLDCCRGSDNGVVRCAPCHQRGAIKPGSDRAKLGITLGKGKGRGAFKIGRLPFLNVDHTANRHAFALGDLSHRFAACPGFLNARVALRVVLFPRFFGEPASPSDSASQ